MWSVPSSGSCSSTKNNFSLDPGTSTLGQARTSWITENGLLSPDGQLFTMRGHLLRLKVKVCATGKNISFSGSTSIAVYATTLLVYRLLKIRCQVGVPSHIFHKSYIYHIFLSKMLRNVVKNLMWWFLRYTHLYRWFMPGLKLPCPCWERLDREDKRNNL